MYATRLHIHRYFLTFCASQAQQREQQRQQQVDKEVEEEEDPQEMEY